MHYNMGGKSDQPWGGQGEVWPGFTGAGDMYRLGRVGHGIWKGLVLDTDID